MKLTKEAFAIRVKTNEKHFSSKNQQDFDTLVSQIKTLQSQIELKTGEIDEIRSRWVKQIIPIKTKAVTERLLLIKMMSDRAKELTFSRRQIQQIGQVIVQMLENLFQYIDGEPATEATALYDEWSCGSCAENEQDSVNFENDKVSDLTSSDADDDAFAMEADVFCDDFEKSSTRTCYENNQSKVRNNSQHRKSKKQLAREAQSRADELAAEAIKTKSLRSIYITLAKVLHPDVTNEGLAIEEREELMKQVSKAYNERDLISLLRFEMEWVHKQLGYLDQLSDEKLGVYIDVLREQRLSLEQEYSRLINDPRNGFLCEYFKGTLQSAKRNIKKDVQRIEDTVRRDREMTKFLDVASKTEFMKYINAYLS